MLKNVLFELKKMFRLKFIIIAFTTSILVWFIMKNIKILYFILKKYFLKEFKVIKQLSIYIYKVISKEFIKFKKSLIKVNKPAWLFFGFILIMFIIMINFQVQSNLKNVKMKLLVQTLQIENNNKNNLIAITHKILEDQHNIYGIGGTSKEILKKAITNYNDFDKINKMPTTFDQLSIENNIKYHGLKNYYLSDDDMIFPISIEYSFVATSAAEFGARWIDLDLPEGLKFHDGFDIYNPYDDNVVSPKDGYITKIGHDIHGGNFIEITALNDFNQKHTIRHLDKIFVEENQKIKRGQRIGLAGNTGDWCFGKHVHWEIKQKQNDRWYFINPVSNSTNQKYVTKSRKIN